MITRLGDEEQLSMIRSVWRLAATATMLAAIVTACASKEPGRRVPGQGSGGAGTKDAGGSEKHDSGVDAAGGGKLDAGSGAGDDRDARADVDAAGLTCGVQTSEAVVAESRPVDVIFVIDNSGSMSNEIKAVEDNINENFARIIEDSGADYRVIMLSHHGSYTSQRICIESPLSGASCDPVPAAPVNGARFFHYDFDVQSWDSLCRILETFDVPDTHAFTLTGWQEWLRPEALKVFVEITDDDVGCSTARGNFTMQTGADPVADAAAIASAFNTALLALSPAQFGTKEAPNYVWHSIIGIKANTPAGSAWLPKAPLQTGICSSAYGAGEGYQMLSIATGGLRYPVCDDNDFDAVFGAIAGEVVKNANVHCHFAVPEAPEGKYVDLDTIRVDYTPGTGGAVEHLERVDDSKCSNKGFTVASGDVKLCDAACTRVRADATAKLSVRFECGEKPPDAPQ
jgi:hypothetical protein